MRQLTSGRQQLLPSGGVSLSPRRVSTGVVRVRQQAQSSLASDHEAAKSQGSEHLKLLQG